MRPWPEYADRLYLDPRGPAHIVEWISPNCTALCGVGDLDAVWFGTGCWDEIERASLMPICHDCQRRAGIQQLDPTGTDPAVADWRTALTSH